MTGAIGGVHREFENTLDVSADLEELSETKVAIVCAGAKIILDLPRTLEYLETKGVPVIGFGTAKFPAYFCATNLAVGARLDSAATIAQVMKAHWALGISTGLVVAIPPPEKSLPENVIEAHLNNALASAESNRVTGKAITPYLLHELETATEGITTMLRRQAILDVADAAAQIACAFCNQDIAEGVTA
jgi:pseudouridine-5'-phosphate glycosidase